MNGGPMARSSTTRRAFVKAAAVAAATTALDPRAAVGAPAFEQVKHFHERELKETLYKDVTIRFFIERWTVSLKQLAQVQIKASASQGDELEKFAEYMGEAGVADMSTYVRSDVNLFGSGDIEKWLYRRVGSAWVAQRVFHPSRKDKVKPGANEKLLEKTPNGEVILESALPQFPTPEEYVKWMAISVSKAKAAETPLGQLIVAVKHIVVSE